MAFTGLLRHSSNVLNSVQAGHLPLGPALAVPVAVRLKDDLDGTILPTIIACDTLPL